MPQSASRILLAALLACLLSASRGLAATWSADASISNERKTDVTEETDGVHHTSTETFKQAYSISYGLDVTPVLELALKFSLDVTDDIKEGPKADTDFDTRQVKPTVTFELRAVWWDAAVGWSKSFDSSDDPKKADIEDWAWSADLNMSPESDAAPTLKLKYKEDVKTDSGITTKIDDTWDAALDYGFWDLMDLSVTAQRAVSDDKVQADSDKQDRKLSTSVTFQRDILENAKLDAKWTNDRSQSISYFDGGDEKDRTDTLKNSLEGKASYKPWESIEVSVNKKLDWNADLYKDKLEVTDTWTSKASFDESFTEHIDFKASYDDERKETRDTQSDSYKITRGYSTSAGLEPVPFLTLTPSFDRKNDDEWFDDPTKESIHKIDDKWEVKGESSFWDDRVKVSATRTFNKTTETDKVTTKQNKWDVSFSFALDSVPNLDVSPKYGYTRDADLLKDTVAEEKKSEVGIKYEIDLGGVSKLALDHSYGRTTRYPAEGQATTKRDDKTNVTMSFSDFVEGMQLELKYSRTASDESKDDKAHQIDYTYGLTYDWDILGGFKYSFSYNYDRKAESEDSQAFKNSFDADFMDGLIVLTVQHEFTEQLEGTTKDTHRYLIEVKGKF